MVLSNGHDAVVASSSERRRQACSSSVAECRGQSALPSSIAAVGACARPDVQEHDRTLEGDSPRGPEGQQVAPVRAQYHVESRRLDALCKGVARPRSGCPFCVAQEGERDGDVGCKVQAGFRHFDKGQAVEEGHRRASGRCSTAVIQTCAAPKTTQDSEAPVEDGSMKRTPS